MSNIYKFMQDMGFADYAQLYQWSINQRAEFWQAAITTVNIKLSKPYSKILDITNGVEKPDWLVGAKLNIVDSCFKAPPDKIAIVYTDLKQEIKNITYGQLQTLVNRISNSLVSLGCVPGDAVAIDTIMSVEAVAIYLAIINVGCTVVGIADSFAATEVAKRLEISAAKLIFTQDVILRSGKQLPLYSKLVDANAPKAIVLPTLDNALSLELRDGDLSWQNFLVSNAEFYSVKCNPHTATNILFSSGTSGEPKAIVWDHTSPIKCAVDGYLYQDIQPSDVVAWPTSLGWMMGPWLIYATLINQATLALFYDAPTSKNFLEFIVAAKVTILGVVPILVRNWRLHNYLSGLDWSNVRLFTSTGEAANASDMQYLIQQSGDKPIIEYCGGTEISGAYITSTLLQPNIPATFSTPALGIEIKLIDQDANYKDIGEVALVPPAIGLSRELLKRENFDEYYANMPLPKDGTILRYHGDQMERLANGYYKSLGRADDTMNLSGIKISSAEIERCFLELNDIVETAAVGVSKSNDITELVIYVVPANGVVLNITELHKEMQKSINNKLNPLFKIIAVRTIEKLPRTSSNKIMRRLLRDMK